ncbi:hypothetical protein [Maridesulfovibrio ferrireducens]|uniref:hypothetical protein n=1 Tax=Maridesulfovibrio ferrireducens TaxID=246191 RepID=UPI001A1FCBA1|nr:hypothetical protein [Maridesulfovibrio ferrireducens]MBI9113285.1 hypothetical protein [Maridesulfovibrio ferrireducens]
MECPYCGEELEHHDSFGRVASHQDGKVLGDIWKCPNGAEQNDSCDSEMFSVSGSFYTYRNREDYLLEGYPC